MCVWNDEYLQAWASKGGVTPYSQECINPASIDLRWSGRYRVWLGEPYHLLVTNQYMTGWSDVRNADFLTVYPETLYLLDSLEYIRMPEDASGFLALKSSTGRRGIEHLHAGFFDPGFHGTATLEILNVSSTPQILTSGERIVQMVIQQLVAKPSKSYRVTGRYNGQSDPQEEIRDGNR